MQPDAQYDLLGYSTDDQLRLVVEVKGRVQEGATRFASEWLQRTSRYYPELFALFVTPAFMLLRQPAAKRLPKPVFIGSMPQMLTQQLIMRLPSQFDYAVNSTACLDAAIDTQRIPLDRLTGGGLERTVSSWLSFALLLPANELSQQQAQKWLVDSGLHEALQNGKVANTSAKPPAYGFAA